MEHIAAILLMLGCSDDAVICTEIPAPHIGYETVEACEADTGRALLKAGDSYPLTIGKCLPVDPLAEGDMEIVWDVTSQGELFAEVVQYGNDDPEPATEVARLGTTDRTSRLR